MNLQQPPLLQNSLEYSPQRASSGQISSTGRKFDRQRFSGSHWPHHNHSRVGSPPHIIKAGKAIAAWWKGLIPVEFEESVSVQYDIETGEPLLLNEYLRMGWEGGTNAKQASDFFKQVAADSATGRDALARAGAIDCLLYLCAHDDVYVQECACRALVHLADRGSASHDMQYEECRIASFDRSICRPFIEESGSKRGGPAVKSGIGWPYFGTRLSPQVMAAAGFFYSPEESGDDRVVCFCCDGALKDWDPCTDSAWEVHKTWFPECRFCLCPSFLTFPCSLVPDLFSILSHCPPPCLRIHSSYPWSTELRSVFPCLPFRTSTQVQKQSAVA